MKYFPFLRGKQYDLLAVKELAPRIVENGRVIPIIEPVKNNASTRLSFGHFVKEALPFLLICNPRNGDFSTRHMTLKSELIDQVLIDYYNWIPSLYVDGQTSIQELRGFTKTYSGTHDLALIYYGRPRRKAVNRAIEKIDFRWHVFIANYVEQAYIQSVPIQRRVQISDSFHRQPRNADYPRREFFTDQNTVSGNPKKLHFGDFLIVGDYYTDSGGPAYAVALHHVHYKKNSRVLDVSHFISDRTFTSADTPGKTIEAVRHLVESLDTLVPNDTQACEEYRQLNQSERFRGLGYMKKLAIMHYLEIMLEGGLER